MDVERWSKEFEGFEVLGFSGILEGVFMFMYLYSYIFLIYLCVFGRYEEKG